MRLAQTLALVFLSIMVPISYAQSAEQVEGRKETGHQALATIRQIISKYKSDPSLVEQIDNVIVESKRFEGAYRASKIVLAGTENGVSYRDYQNLIKPFLAEASIVKDTAISSDEQLLAQTYVDAATVYAAAGQIWSATLGSDLSPSALWSAGNLVLTKANDAYLRNYRLELSTSATPTPKPMTISNPTAKKAKK